MAVGQARRRWSAGEGIGISIHGGFSAVPPRLNVGLCLALLIFLVGGVQTNPAIKELGRAFTSGNHIVAQHAAGKLIWCLRTEDSLRLAILILMVLPL